MRELRHIVGLVAALAAAVFWAELASRHPTNTYHFAPLIVAAAWVAVDGARGAGLTPRRIVNQALGGLAIAVAVIWILETKGDLKGPVFWDSSDDAPVVVEHVVFAAAGAVLGGVFAWRSAARPFKA